MPQSTACRRRLRIDSCWTEPLRGSPVGGYGEAIPRATSISAAAFTVLYGARRRQRNLPNVPNVRNRCRLLESKKCRSSCHASVSEREILTPPRTANDTANDTGIGDGRLDLMDMIYDVSHGLQ